MKKAILFIFRQLGSIYERLATLLDRIRARIPGLPGNRAIIAAGGLVCAVVILLATFQVLLAPKDKFTTFTLPYEQNFEDVNLRRWFVGDGVWSIRDSALAQTVGGDKPAQAYIPNKLIEDSPYHASVYITLKKDSRAAGISFNAQYPNLTNKQHRVYLSRPDKSSLELVSGYMDDTGSFVTQIQVPLSINTTEFRLDLYVYESTYLVLLNGQRMIDNRPLFYKNGLIGFYALGPAVFDTVKITATDTQNPGNMVYASDFDQVPGGAGWVPFNGEWKIASKKMVQSDPAIVTAGIGYETSSFENFTLKATFNQVANQGAGVLFNMPSPYQLNGAQVVRYSDEADSFIWGYYDDKGAFTRQGFVNIAPAGTAEHVIQVYSGDTSYDIFLDEQVLARDVPLQSKRGNIGLTTSLSTAEFSLVEAFPLFGVSGGPSHQLTPLSSSATPPTPTPGTANPTETMVANQTTPTKPSVIKTSGTQVGTPKQALTKTPGTPVGTPKQAVTNTPGALVGTLTPAPGNFIAFHGIFTGTLAEQHWVALNGAWKFQDNTFVQTRTDGYDFAAINTKTSYTDFSYQIGLSHQSGSGAGLIFNIPNSDRLSGATMVRYSDRRDNALTWGYFDENGVYKNQGYADVNPAGQDHHTIRVTSRKASYSIYLDDHLVVQSVAFGSGQNSGYIGLLSSVSSVTYDEVTVDSVGAAFRGNYSTLEGFSDQRSISGKWVLNNNTITQNVPETADYVWNTGVLASKYTISAKISLPKNAPTAGGGFITHMSERGTKNSAFIIRITNGGKGVWWGPTDETGKFKGLGSVPLKSTASTFVLKIVVDGEKIAIFVNDQSIVSDVATSLSDGWIGLVAYGGPVKFENLILKVTQ